MDGPAAPTTTTDDHVLPTTGRFREVLDRRAEWIEAAIILVPIAVAFVVLGFLAQYFADVLKHLDPDLLLCLAAGLPHLAGGGLDPAHTRSTCHARWPCSR